MLRFTRAPFLRQTRAYSFDVMSYLNRIEAISKTKPGPRKGSQSPGASRADATAGSRRPKTQPRQPRAASAGAANPQNNAPKTRRPARKPSANTASTTNSSPRAMTSAPRTGSRDSAKISPKTADRAPTEQPASAPLQAQSGVKSEWGSLEALPRTSRRVFRKPGAKSRARPTRAKPRRETAQTRSKPEATAAYQPFLSPMEALDVVFRNEGTSSGGFIAPLDVSLAALQPNFGESSVSLNARIRSLLNAPNSAADDREQLQKLVETYISGNYFEIPPGKNPQGLVDALNANRSLLPTQKEFLASVAQGKISPKKVARL